MRIKAIVATNNAEIKDQFEKEALFLDNKLEVLAYVKSGDEVLQRFGDINPRVLIIDKDIDGISALECIRRINDKKGKCRILVMGDCYDGEFMYQLFKFKVAGYIKKPINIEEVNKEIKKVSEDIRRVTLEDIDYDATLAMQSLYFWKLMFENSDNAHDMNFTNSIMGINFKSGIFRAILFRLDQVHGELPKFEKPEFYTRLKVIQQQIKAFTNTYIYEYCYDMIFDFRFNGVLSIINYDEKYDKIIMGMLEDLRNNIEKFTVINYGMTVTICVGSGYGEFCDVYKSREEAYSVSWSRRKKGIGKVLVWRKSGSWQSSYNQKMEDIVENLKITADTLNIENFHKSIKELFTLPDFVLSDYKTRNYILGFVDYFFDVNGSVLSQHMNVEQEKESVKKVLNFSYTMDNYSNNLKEKFDTMFKMLSNDLDKQNIRPMRVAIKYIKKNYKSVITAETLANEVNLSPVYFSHLFKKQIGMNMTDYITEYRIELAKRDLVETERSIYEIAVDVGFQDQRYFSKRFKQVVGMTPTEYRNQK